MTQQLLTHYFNQALYTVYHCTEVDTINTACCRPQPLFILQPTVHNVSSISHTNKTRTVAHQTSGLHYIFISLTCILFFTYSGGKLTTTQCHCLSARTESQCTGQVLLWWTWHARLLKLSINGLYYPCFLLICQAYVAFLAEHVF